MPAPTSIAELLELARKSGVVDEQRLDAHVKALRDANELPNDPATLAVSLVQAGVLTNFQSEQLVQGKWRRFTIGKYKVLERLGSGGMGSVFLCEHKFMRRRVAVKVLPTAKAADPSSLERFYREARAVAAVDHPNIVHAYDIDQDDTLHFLVMEYVNGPSLQEIVRRGGPLSVERACHYISQAADGLEHASRAGLVHRDIKPGNILVDSTGIVKILDMGLARFFNDEEDMLTRKYDENVLGTADYLAPEQADDSHTVDVRADIYSLGGTLCYVLTGKTPFGEGTVAQKLMWHRTRQPKPVSTFREDVPAELQAVLCKMMEKEPEQRYQTPAEVSTALATWTLGPPPPPTEKEMPQLSPAASAYSAADSASSVKKSWLVSTAETGKEVNGGNYEISPTVKMSSAVAEQIKRMAGAVPSRQAVRSTSSTTVDKHGPGEDDGSPWSGSGPDTANSIAMDDTPPQMPALKRMFGTSGIRERFRFKRTPWWVIVIGSLVAALVVVIAVWLASSVLFGSQQTLTVGRAGRFGTVKAALAEAGPGDIIVLQDREHRESLAWEGSGLSNIRIQGAHGVDVSWAPPSVSAADEPLMSLKNAKGFQIVGLRFSGEDRSRTLLWLVGHCPGLRVENVRFEGFTRSAIVLSNCTGTSAEPVQLNDIRTTTGGQEADSAIVFDALHADPPNNEYIFVRSSRLDGAFRQGPFWFKKERSSTIVIQK